MTFVRNIPMPDRTRVTAWGENVHEYKNPIVATVYPNGMHRCIADGLREDAALEVRGCTGKAKRGFLRGKPA